MTASKIAAASFVAALAFVTAACSSSTEGKGATASEPVSGRYANVVSATATVTAVDLSTRHVTLQGEDGKKFTVVCGDEVRNLPQIKVGDVLTVSFQESLAYEVHKPGEVEPGAAVMAGAGRAKEGEKPGAGIGAAIQVTATIVAIDRATNYVTLKGPDGELVTMKAQHPEKLARVAVGDLVEITYSEALAVSVTTPTGR